MLALLQELDNEESPIDRLLREQARLETAVASFSRLHEQGEVEERYRSLIPLENPRPGEQFAFEVNLDKCTGCKACVTACHSLNGLDEHETWRDVGLIHGQRQQSYYQQTVTTACHHCVEPGCLEGCPVNAYEKDPATGIVLHLDDQCIGCQYCVLKCPYDVPKYNARLGIVRKCDMCHGRLAEGEPPACVQACPTEAISIKVVARDVVTAKARSTGTAPFLPDAPHQDYTVPTTAYVSKRLIPGNAIAADAEVLRPQHAHWPLVWMLSLTQMSVGLSVAVSFATQSQLALGIGAAVTGFAGLAASVLHLGRPLGAWRAFLGLTHSWLSREIFAFGGYAPLLAFSLVSTVLTVSQAHWAWAATAALGLGAIFTSVMIYHDTRRKFWALQRTAIRFFGVTASFAGGGLLLGGNFNVGGTLLLVSALVQALAEGRILMRAGNGLHDADTHSARIQFEHDFPALVLRWLGLTFGVLLLLGDPQGALGMVGITLLGLSAIAERYLFFTAVVAPKMPGGVKA